MKTLSSVVSSQLPNYLPNEGKWHLGEALEAQPQNRGHDETLGFLVGAMRYSNDGPEIINAPLNALLDDLLFANLGTRIHFNGGAPFAPNEYMTDYFAKEGC